VFSLLSVFTLIVFGAIGAIIGWRRGTKAIHRRSVSEPNLAPGETKRDYDRRLRRRRKLWRIVGALFYGLIGMGIALVLASVSGMRH
jgi:hypothetical protein